MKTISTILKDEREKRGLSLDDVVAATKIRKNFIVAIEEGKFSSLPSEAYAMGFVKNYGEFLGIAPDRAAALFRREYDSKNAETIPKFRKAVRVSNGSFSLKSARSFLILGVAVVVLVYISYQFSFLFIGPKLSILTPKEGQAIPANIVSVSGKTDPHAAVTINNEDVYVDLTGSFKKTLYVYSGQGKISVTAKNRYGKETKKEVQIKVE